MAGCSGCAKRGKIVKSLKNVKTTDQAVERLAVVAGSLAKDAARIMTSPRRVKR